MAEADELPLLAVVGPTAVGKSDLALRLAEAWKGEIISADSVQIYRGLDIGSAKPSREDRERIPHHLIDVAEPDQPFSVAVYSRLFFETARAVLARGHLPILVGGSGLYIRAVLRGFDFARTPANPELRQQLLAGYRAGKPLPNPLRIHPHDLRRLVRAAETAEAGPPGQRATGLRPLVIGLRLEREVLYDRINRRAAAMLPGLLREAEVLRGRGLGPEIPALRSLGYREANLYLDGLLTEAEALRLIQRNTRHFAKRQLTWWRRDPSVLWFDATPDSLQRINYLIASTWLER